MSKKRNDRKGAAANVVAREEQRVVERAAGMVVRNTGSSFIVLTDDGREIDSRTKLDGLFFMNKMKKDSLNE